MTLMNAARIAALTASYKTELAELRKALANPYLEDAQRDHITDEIDNITFRLKTIND